MNFVACHFLDNILNLNDLMDLTRLPSVFHSMIIIEIKLAKLVKKITFKIKIRSIWSMQNSKNREKQIGKNWSSLKQNYSRIHRSKIQLPKISRKITFLPNTLAVFLVGFLLAASSLGSQIDSDIEYIRDNGFPIPRYHYNRIQKLISFKINLKSTRIANNVFSLLVKVPLQMANEGGFYSSENRQIFYSFVQDATNSVATKTIQGNFNEINQFLENLHFLKNSKQDQDKDYQISYVISDSQNRRDELFFQIQTAESIKMDVLSDANSISVKPGSNFVVNVATISESESLIKLLQPNLRHNSAVDFIEAKITENMLVLRGIVPSNINEVSSTFKIHVRLSVIDPDTAESSQLLTYDLLLDDGNPRSSDNLSLVAILGSVGVFSLLLLLCLIVILKKEKRKEKEKIRVEIQEQGPQDANILTRSILEWPRNNVANSDSTIESTVLNKGKRGVLYTPYDKFNLKSKPVGKQSKPEPRKDPQSQEKFDSNQKYRLTQGKSKQTSEEKQQQELYSPEIKKNLAEILGGLKDEKLQDLSDLNFTAIGGLGNDMANQTLGMDFGDMSKIGNFPQMITGGRIIGQLQELDEDIDSNDDGDVLGGLQDHK